MLTPFPNRDDYKTTTTEQLHRMKLDVERRIFALTRQIATEHEYRNRILTELGIRHNEIHDTEG